MCVLRWLSGLDMPQLNLLFNAPSQEVTTGQLWFVRNPESRLLSGSRRGIPGERINHLC